MADNPLLAPHQYALDFPKRPADSASAPTSSEPPPPKKRKSSIQAMPGQTIKRVGNGVSRTTNDKARIEKGSPGTEYASSPSGWTTTNNPHPKPTPYDDLDLEDDYDDEKGYDGGESEGPVTDAEREIEEEDGTITKKIREIHIKTPVVLALDTNIVGSGLGSIDGLDLASVLKKDPAAKFSAKFSAAQDARMSLFILKNKTHLVLKLRKEFADLLSELGFKNGKLQPGLMTALRNKVYVKLHTLRDSMVRAGSAREVKGGLEFAPWTEEWKNSGGDGDITGPSLVVQKAFESGWN